MYSFITRFTAAAAGPTVLGLNTLPVVFDSGEVVSQSDGKEIFAVVESLE